MQTVATSSSSGQPVVRHERVGNRRKIRVPGRLTWRDASGTLRFADGPDEVHNRAIAKLEFAKHVPA